VTIDMTPTWKQALTDGNVALAKGRAYDAQKHYATAEGYGLPLAFAAVHGAMAQLLLGRHADARATVERALPHAAGIFVHAQLLALLPIADAMSGRADTGDLARLENCLLELTETGLSFDLRQSDLRYLMRGAIASHVLTDRPRAVFRLLVAWPTAAAA
jgi:hypothetical protein